MRNLCDSNVLVALVAENHPHHEPAAKWAGGLAEGETLAICRMTQLSFLRLLTVEAVMKNKVQTNSQALEILSGLMEDPRVEFIMEEPHGTGENWLRWSASRRPSPKAWMDAYLAAFAASLSSRLVTFDKASERFKSAGLDVLVLS